MLLDFLMAVIALSGFIWAIVERNQRKEAEEDLKLLIDRVTNANVYRRN